MHRAVVLAYWEIRRVLRSRRAAAAVLIVPAVGAAACLLPWHSMASALKVCFPAVAVLFAWLIIYIRASSDRVSGFAAGIDSSPAAGGIAFAARFLTWLVLALVQIGIFHSVVRIVG